MNSTIKHLLLALLSAGMVAATVGCSDDDDDDDDDAAPAATDSSDANADADADADADTDAPVDPSARPGLARIIVECDSAQSPITVFINGDDIAPDVAQTGGEFFANTVLGDVTYSAMAEGVTFASVTVTMVESTDSAFQTVRLVCR